MKESILLGRGWFSWRFSPFVVILLLFSVKLRKSIVKAGNDDRGEDEHVGHLSTRRHVFDGNTQKLHLVFFSSSVLLCFFSLPLLLPDLHLLIEVLHEFDDGVLLFGGLEILGNVSVGDIGQQVEKMGGVEVGVLDEELDRAMGTSCTSDCVICGSQVSTETAYSLLTNLDWSSGLIEDIKLSICYFWVLE